MITLEQIAMLKFFIFQSNDANDLAKRLLFFLIDESKGLTEPVSVGFVQDQDGYTGEEIQEVAYALHDMRSSNCTTRLGELMRLMGTNLRFSVHYGHYNKRGEFHTGGMFPGVKKLLQRHENDRNDEPINYTFWLTEELYGHSGPGNFLTTPNKRDLMKIDLENLEE